MPHYTVAMVGPPTSNFTLTSRTYELTTRICTDGDPCDLFPIAIQNSNISYPNPPPAGDPLSALPQTYDLSFYGCPDEVDLGAVLSGSSGGQQVEPNDCDYDEMEAIRGEPIPTKDCLCCREYTFTWTAEVVDGNTVADDVVNDTCPNISVDSFVVEKRLETAEFRGFFGSTPCGCGDGWALSDESNISGTEEQQGIQKDCLGNAFAKYATAIETAEDVYEDAIAAAQIIAPGFRDKKLKELKDEYEAAKTAAFKTFQEEHAECIEDNPNFATCWPMTQGDCITPRSPNGSMIELYEAITEKIITVEHLALYHDVNFFDPFEGKVNENQFNMTFPCQCFTMVAAPETLKLNKVDAVRDTFNEVKVWRRRYEFHYRAFGWDEYIPLTGVDRAVCEGAPEGTFFKDDDEVCQTGTFADDDCLDACNNLPAKAAIADVFGNGVREPMNLTIEGQPSCRVDLPLYTGWRTTCTKDFAELNIPQMFTPDVIRPTLTTAAPGEPPEETCEVDIDGETRTVYYQDICTIYTWQCDCTAGPCNWVLV